jgi:Tfp pilus assembly protein PilF
MEHLGAGNRTEAEAWLTRTVQEHPSYPPTYYQLAKLTAQHGKLAEAVHLLETGIQQAMTAKDHLTLREMRSLLSELQEDLE